MNSTERLMAVLTGKTPDRIPWAPLIDGYYTQSLPEQGLNMNEIQIIKHIGADVLLRHVNIVKSKFKNVEYKTIRNGNEELRIYETKVGNVESKYIYSGNTCFKKEPFIKSVENIKTMQYIAENTTYEKDYDVFNKAFIAIGDSGLASPSLPLTPIQSLLQTEMGIETFTYFLYDYPEEMEEFMSVLHSKNLENIKLNADSPENMKIFIEYEDTSTTVMSPAWFKKYAKGCIDEYADILHKNDKIFITHMCGKLTGMVSSLIDAKMDGIDSVCPPTTGDLWSYEALERLPGKIIIGGIEPPALQRMSVEETKAYVRNVITKSKPFGRFILSTGDATSHGTPVENLKAVTEIIKELGNY